MKKINLIIVGILATLVGLYPIIYFFVDRKFGLLSSKSAELLSNNFWNIAFYGHIIFGGLALLVGWLQFSNRLLLKNMKLHRAIGKIYLVSVLISGICGLVISFYATGGIISALGFFSLGVTWLSTTILGFKSIKIGNVQMHEKFMIFSYAACFSAVTLRIWLPILIGILGNFNDAYRIVAWLSWVPNLMVAYIILRGNNLEKF
ncbi:Predicted membrane protein [Kaistella chaponensis]|uniref:Predicted membrane protein n=1 Tax=Kaistella chaponensis TaxID=713588 RepID=A0A1N7L623_9FLAO|nr:DUF2306 domain-containing protein [Kaistella chaponensis]SIS69241.1 Predicted membrane protein [Kaistella chaponensis]